MLMLTLSFDIQTNINPARMRVELVSIELCMIEI